MATTPPHAAARLSSKTADSYSLAFRHSSLVGQAAYRIYRNQQRSDSKAIPSRSKERIGSDKTVPNGVQLEVLRVLFSGTIIYGKITLCKTPDHRKILSLRIQATN